MPRAPKTSASLSVPVPQATERLKVRIARFGAQICNSMSEVLSQVAHKQVRPIELSRQLGIDDSLAAKLIRALRATDPIAAMRELPAPLGLRIFLAAARKAGARTEALERAELSL